MFCCVLNESDQSSTSRIQTIGSAGTDSASSAPSLQGGCEWSRHRKQAVYFLRSPWQSSGDGGAALSYSFTFEPGSGDVRMDFSVGALWRQTVWRFTLEMFSMIYLDFILKLKHKWFLYKKMESVMLKYNRFYSALKTESYWIFFLKYSIKPNNWLGLVSVVVLLS